MHYQAMSPSENPSDPASNDSLLDTPVRLEYRPEPSSVENSVLIYSPKILLDEIAKQERLEQERLEQERLERERLEQERLEQERLEQETQERERQEQERLEQERLEPERLEQERLEQGTQELERRKNRLFKLLVSFVVVLLLCIVAVALVGYLSRGSDFYDQSTPTEDVTSSVSDMESGTMPEDPTTSSPIASETIIAINSVTVIPTLTLMNPPTSTTEITVTLTVTNTPTPTPEPPDTPISLPPCVNDPEEGCSYTIRPGDNLGQIAIDAYGDYYLYDEICTFNSDVLDNDCNLPVDQIIQLPARNVLVQLGTTSTSTTN